jgi:hypothetical protein
MGGLQAVKKLLASYPPHVQEMALAARSVVRSALPHAVEMPDTSANVVGYGFGAGYKNLICTLILSKAEIKLGFFRGAEFLDPKRLMEGTGNRHRYVRLRTAADLKKPGLRPLLRAAAAAWRARGVGSG